jgi:hypothetical protein
MNSIRSISILIFFLSFLVPRKAFTQEIVTPDSIQVFSSARARIKPQFHYNIGSSFTFIPRYGSVTSLFISPYLSYPLSPKISVEAGLFAGRYYSTLKNISPESGSNNSFNALSIYGSARYQLNERLSVYGTGIKHLAGSTPFCNIPSSSLTIGSTLNFGNFSIGAAIQMSDWNNYYSPYRYGGNPDYFSSFPW